MSDLAQIGMIGLGVMGANVARNFANNGFKTVVYNRDLKVAEDFMKNHGNENLIMAKSLEDFVQKLERPRKAMMLITAGNPVDQVTDALLELLEEGDLIIDGGNSNFKDTIRREEKCAARGIHFVGMGVSGGEEGALKGPSMMPGGSPHAWETIQPIVEAVSARDFSDGPCVTHIGANGAGHYVKMVHNGIEYAVMQVMAEGYDILRKVYGQSAPQLAEIFKKYNAGKLQSFLFEIAIDVLSQPDEFNEGAYLIDAILDKAGQKGTGRWTAVDGFERGVAIPNIGGAVTARILSSKKDQRVKWATQYEKKAVEPTVPLEQFIATLEDALYAGMLLSYAQGYELIQSASREQEWSVDLAEVSRIWEGGCIIRAQILNFLHKAFEKSGSGVHMLDVPEVVGELNQSMNALRMVAAQAISAGVSAPVMSASLAYFDSLTTENSSANFIQGLRDRFGSHTYERTDREGSFHTLWTS